MLLELSFGTNQHAVPRAEFQHASKLDVHVMLHQFSDTSVFHPVLHQFVLELGWQGQCIVGKTKFHQQPVICALGCSFHGRRLVRGAVQWTSHAVEWTSLSSC